MFTSFRNICLLLIGSAPLAAYASADTTRRATQDTIPVVRDDEPVIPVGMVDEKPVFKDEHGNDFLTYIAKHVKYPAATLDGTMQGTVYVEFIVDKGGWVTHAKVIRGINPALDEEALRVIITAPNWTPGKHQGKPVSVRYVYPVSFNL